MLAFVEAIATESAPLVALFGPFIRSCAIIEEKSCRLTRLNESNYL